MTHFADCANYETSLILKNELIAKDTRLLRFQSSQMAQGVVPGQFFMLRTAGGNDPLIGRAFALYDCCAESGWVEIVYLVKGKLTRQLSLLREGDEVVVWGPLGNGFSTTPCDRLILVAGGIGQTPFLSLAREALGSKTFALLSSARTTGYARRVEFCYGVRTAEYLASIDDFESAGVRVTVATEDGSYGRKGWVTDALLELLDRNDNHSQRVVCCGPEPMMEAVAKICAQRHIDCEVSLETPMACGIGICFSCVAKVGHENDWDYKRTCVEGPIFDAANIVW